MEILVFCLSTTVLSVTASNVINTFNLKSYRRKEKKEIFDKPQDEFGPSAPQFR